MPKTSVYRVSHLREPTTASAISPRRLPVSGASANGHRRLGRNALQMKSLDELAGGPNS